MGTALLAQGGARRARGLFKQAQVFAFQRHSYSPVPETTTHEQAIQGVAGQPSSDSGHQQPPTARWFPGAALSQFGRDLTDQARRGLLDPVIGREAIVQRALQVIMRRTKNNPCLIGDAGVGKTAIVEGIAQLMVSPQAPPGLAGKRLIALDVTSLVAGSAYRGEFEGRLRGLLKDVADARGSVILFIDEMHMLMGAGASEGGLDASNILKPALARGGLLQCIGATTVEEWRQHIEPDAAFTRRWQPIMVQEPSAEAAYACLQGLRPRYEAHHSVVITDAALKAAVRCAKRHITDRKLPDSAIDIIDESAARCLLRSGMEMAEAARACAADAVAAAAAAEAQAASASGRAHLQSRGQASAEPSSSSSSSTPGPAPHLTGLGTGASSHAQPPLYTSVVSEQGWRADGSAPRSSGAAGSSTSTSSSAGGDSGDGKGGSRGAALTDWQTWVARNGWQGQTEHERQQLLEWFGATPDNPVPGPDGHRQTAAKRSMYRQAMIGGQPLDATAAAAAAHSHASVTTAVLDGAQPRGSADPSLDPSLFASFLTLKSLPEGVRRLEVTPQTLSKGKACPQCGYLCEVRATRLSDDGLRLRCPSCNTSFLNIPPEKLLLGTSTFQADPPPFHHSSAPSQAQQAGHSQQAEHALKQGLGQQGPGLDGSRLEEQQPQDGQARLEQQPGHIGIAPITPQIQQLQLERQQQQAIADAFARPFPIHCVVDEQDVLEAVTEATGVPVTAMDNQSAHQLMGFEQSLSQVVLGQEAAVRAVASAVRLWRMGLLQTDHRPAASFVFRGPRGVGKTLMCKELARQVMGNEEALLRLQMSEYTDRASLARLLGAPPGYVGYGKASGTLVDAVRRRPHCVLVLEDVDKAHPEVQEVLLRIVEDGSLSDSQGRRASFESAFVIFTLSRHPPALPARGRPQDTPHSQQQQQEQQQQEQLQQEEEGALSLQGRGATQQQEAHSSQQHLHAASHAEEAAAALQGSQAAALAHSSSSSGGTSDNSARGGHATGSRPSRLPPAVAQLLGLVDAAIDFAPLGRQQLVRIVEAQLAEAAAQLQSPAGGLGGAAGVALEVDDTARAFLVDAAERRAGGPGAQHVRGLIRTHVLGPLAEQLLQQQAQLDAEGGGSGRSGEMDHVGGGLGHAVPVVRISYHGPGRGLEPGSSQRAGDTVGSQAGVSIDSRTGCLRFSLCRPL